MVAILVYHRNAEAIYPKAWIDKFRESVLNQTHRNFDIIENNYGGSDFRIFDKPFSEFHNVVFPTFVHSMNWQLDRAFHELKYDYVYNSNVDDFVAPNWLEKQLEYLRQGYDLVSSNFALVKDDKIVKEHQFHNLDILGELKKMHNPISHPSVAYSKRFWETNRYKPEEVPIEDLLLWKRAIEKGAKAIILPDCLLFHRLHENSVCQSENR